jgi:hypothetical protein
MERIKEELEEDCSSTVGVAREYANILLDRYADASLDAKLTTLLDNLGKKLELPPVGRVQKNAIATGP